MFEYFSSFFDKASGFDAKFSLELRTSPPRGLAEGFKLETDDWYLCLLGLSSFFALCRSVSPESKVEKLGATLALAPSKVCRRLISLGEESEGMLSESAVLCE